MVFDIKGKCAIKHPRYYSFSQSVVLGMYDLRYPEGI